MDSAAFTIPVKPATKKNHSRLVTLKTGRQMMLPSKQYFSFERDCLPYLNRVKRQTGVIDYPVNIECVFYTETRRRVDLANLLNAIDDAMVKSGLLLDDNRDVIAGHDGSRVFHDKEHPRIEVKLTKIENYEQWSK